ncbi:GyrI-like domain-containing protein [Desulfobacter sp. UBA2225]|uniref:GyrI-like domain-containing protein n=1 Tax=Desulfobacter sp. UBA2225 TaxID=1961413 RepID=UPI00257D1A5D|nr:GyrI-like domain-containing protein [Desulfobacter sp. UBA2225]
MKRIGYALMLLCLAAGLLAQQEPRIRESGENFTYAALECMGSYEQVPQKLGELMAEFQKQNLEMLGGPSMIYYNSPAQVKPEELRWDACLPVHALEKVAPPLKKGEYKYPLVAEMIYKGPYTSLGAAYPVLMEFIARGGYAVSGPICESYMDDPTSTKPEDCRTLIVVPVRK